MPTRPELFYASKLGNSAHFIFRFSFCVYLFKGFWSHVYDLKYSSQKLIIHTRLYALNKLVLFNNNCFFVLLYGL